MNVVVVTGTQCTAGSVRQFLDHLGRRGLPAVVHQPFGRTVDQAARHLVTTTDNTDGPVIVVGHSLGGTVALAAARLAPGAFAGLVIVATNPAAPRDDQLRTWDRHERLARTQGPAAVAREMIPALFGPDNGSPEWRRRAALAQDMATETGLPTFLDQLAIQRSRMDEVPPLGRLSVPLLVVHGACDRLVSLADAVTARRTAPRSQLRILPCGHMVPLEQPVELADVVADWTASLRRPAPAAVTPAVTA